MGKITINTIIVICMILISCKHKEHKHKPIDAISSGAKLTKADAG